MNDWLSDVFFNWPAAESAFRDGRSLIPVAEEFLAGSPFDVTAEELAADFLSRV
jgi:hypothetical protein